MIFKDKDNLHFQPFIENFSDTNLGLIMHIKDPVGKMKNKLFVFTINIISLMIFLALSWL